MQIIKYKDPLGRQLDLIRVPRRTIHFDMPNEYHGPKVEDVKQAVKFTREQIIEDNGDKYFTDWHCDDPFWAEYEPQRIEGFIPSQKIIEQKEVTPQANGEDVHIEYALHQQTFNSEKSVDTEELLSENDNEMNSQGNNNSSSNNSNSIYQKSLTNQSSSNSKEHFSYSNSESSSLNINQSISLSTSGGSETIKQSFASQLNSTSSLNESNSFIADSMNSNSTSINHLENTEPEYTKPFVVPKEIQLIPMSSNLAYLRHDRVVSNILSSLKIIGYFYFSDGEWKEKTLYSGEY